MIPSGRSRGDADRESISATSSKPKRKATSPIRGPVFRTGAGRTRLRKHISEDELNEMIAEVCTREFSGEPITAERAALVREFILGELMTKQAIFISYAESLQRLHVGRWILQSLSGSIDLGINVIEKVCKSCHPWFKWNHDLC
jgi:hypothetical protein